MSRWYIPSDDQERTVTILHYRGNPVVHDDMEGLFTDGRTYDSAICLGSGSVVGESLSKEARDSRILTILLVLRKLQKMKPMHIIAENMMDQTASVALTPIAPDGSMCEPDFINTQAIIARVLAMSLAYPEIDNAITELVDGEAGTPEVDFLSAAQLHITNKTVTFGAIQIAVLSLFKYRGVAIGFIQQSSIGDRVCGSSGGSQLKLAPNPNERRTWLPNDRIVVMVRNRSLSRTFKLLCRALRSLKATGISRHESLPHSLPSRGVCSLPPCPTIRCQGDEIEARKK